MPVARHREREIGAPTGICKNQSLPARPGEAPDGYHELRTIFQTISLHDTLTLSITRVVRSTLFDRRNDGAAAGRKILCSARSKPSAAKSGFDGGVHVHLEKRIPVARGLGGGSSDAAAALIGMLRLTECETAASDG